MDDRDLENIKRAITLASECKPTELHIPRVGAVIAVGDVVIGKGKRGNGGTNDDEHAEYNAFKTVADRTELAKATVYTTLEPCTREVRSKPLECCTELILQARVKKVFIGILDPNQGVRGKGLWDLQSKGVEIELFPPEMARQILAMNQEFIRFQSTIGAHILGPKEDERVDLRKGEQGGWYGECTLVCRCENPPDPSIKIITQRGGDWWPARNELSQIGDTRNWSAKIFFGGEGDHTIHIVKATESGAVLLAHYQDVVNQGLERRGELERRLKENKIDTNLLRNLPGIYVAIKMGGLPKGLESLAHVQVHVIIKQP